MNILLLVRNKEQITHFTVGKKLGASEYSLLITGN
jgi:hypothetical protein